MKRLFGFPLVTWLLFLPGLAQEGIPSRPEELKFPELEFEVPNVEGLRMTLQNGVPVYIAEDHLLPLVTLRIYLKGGSYLVPAGKEGLGSLAGTVWRTGGAGDYDAKALDEELDFLAARLSTSVGPVRSSISLNLLAKDLLRGLDLFMDVLLEPRFEEARLKKAKEDLLAGMKQRNDDTADIEGREWTRLIYGDDFWMNRLPTELSVTGLTRDDLVSFHRLLLNPANWVVAIAGDFERAEMMAALNETVGQMAVQEGGLPEIPQPTNSPEPGVYIIDKPDVNQGRVSIGHIGIKRPVEEEFDLAVMNDVLGGGGFTSWIVSRVRSDEGLAYSAGSSYSIGNTVPGTFRAYFQSKSSSCARAAKIVLELVQKMRIEGSDPEELETSKASFIQTFPNRFQSALQTVAVFAADELLGRSHDYWTEYRNRVRQVTGDSSREAAARFLHPEKMIVLVVGNMEEILAGDPEFPDIKLGDLGEIIKVPLRDPMTLEPMQ